MKITGQSIESDSIPVIDSMPAFSVVADPAYIYASSGRNPFSVSRIDQKTIDQLAEPTIEPLLNSVPGIWMQTGALNTNRISIRGVGYREPFATTGIKIYLDEIPLTNGVGESSIEDIHPQILSGVDIWRGPASALWGSGLGGMIHLKSKVPTENYFSSAFQVGSYERFQTDQNLSLRYGKENNFSTNLHYQFLHDEGYRDNNDYKKQSMTWIQRWSISQGVLLSAFIHGIDLKAFIPSSLNENDYNNNPAMAAPTWGLVQGNEDYSKWISGLNFIWSRSKHWIYQGSLHGTFFNSDEVRPFNVLDESNTAYGMRHRVSIKIRENGHLNLGAEYFNETYSFSTFETLTGGNPGDKLSDQSEDRTYLNGFAQAEFDLSKRCILFGGLHLSRNKMSSATLENKFPLALYPTAGLNYSLNQITMLSASVSRGYSNLSLDDLLNSEGLITPGIKPETGWSEEAAVTIGNLEKSYVRLGVYHMNINNSVITLRIVDDIFEKVNLGSSVHEGVELEYKWEPVNSKINIKGSYTFTSNHSNEINFGGNLPGNPKHRTFNRLGYKPSGFIEIYMIHHGVSDVFLNDANTSVGKGYHLMNGGLIYMMPIGKKVQLTLSGTLHNIFDVHYSSMFQINAPSANGAAPRYFYPGKPRSLYSTLRFQYLLS